MTGYYVGVGWSAKSQTNTFFSTTPGERVIIVALKVEL